MNQVPNIISTKDLSFIEDMFNWHFNASKEMNHFKDEATDAEVIEIITRASNMHTEICKTLLTLIEGGNYEQ